MTAGAPRVSVLLPVRDALPTLDACLASLAAQTLGDHEVVAVDDGSRDGSRERLLRAAREDPRLRVLEVPRPGLVPSLNAAAAAARAPLLARMDADDVCHPDRLRLQEERLGRAPDVVLGTRVRLLSEGVDNAGMRAYVEWLNGLVEHEAIVRDLWVESPLAHPSVMLSAVLFHALGGYRELDGPEDYDLWLRAHEKGARFAKCPEVLLDWRDRPLRLTRTDGRYAPEKFRAVKIEALERTRLVERPAVVIWGAGPIGKGWARALAARGHAVAAFVEVDPRKIGERIHGAPVVAVGDARLFPHALHLAAVGRPGAREEIRREAARLGLIDGRDLLAVA